MTHSIPPPSCRTLHVLSRYLWFVHLLLNLFNTKLEGLSAKQLCTKKDHMSCKLAAVDHLSTGILVLSPSLEHPKIGMVGMCQEDDNNLPTCPGLSRC